MAHRAQVKALVKVSALYRKRGAIWDAPIAWAYRVCVDDLIYRDVDDRLAQSHHVRVLIHVKLLLWLGDVTRSLEKHPARQDQSIRVDYYHTRKILKNDLLI